MTTSTQTTKLTAQQIADFDRDGFLVRRQFFAADEIGSLIRAYEEDQAISGRARAVADGQGGHTEIALWNAPGEDVFGAVARSAKLVTAVQALLRDEVYHYHSKVNLKRPHSGGTWVWHQDYGYWYNNGCLYPDMVTVGLPLSPMNKQNGCLQLIPGSNRMGRIDHLQVGEQTGADAARVQAILERVQPVAIEAEPGDAVFFHCNTLHTSDPNRSDVPRNLLLIAYNARHNDPYREGPRPRYTPLDVLPDEAIMERSHLRDGEARVFSKE